MRKILAYPLTLVHLLIFGVLITVFHGVQLFCHHILGYTAHKRSVDFLNRCLMWSLWPLGVRFRCRGDMPKPGPSYIFVSNHQSMFDIPPLIWYLRAYHVKFISKIELMKANIPSISYNLKVGGHANIDRKDTRQALSELIRFSKDIHQKGRSVMIFPEGTRSKTGRPRPFKQKGLRTLFKYIPNAIVVPITINNSWKVMPYGSFPYGIGARVELTIHTPIPLQGNDPQEVIDRAEAIVTAEIREVAP